MAKTKIRWTDQSWNPIDGCDKTSPGCDHCYAETIALRFAKRNDAGDIIEHSSAYPNGFAVTFHEDRLREYGTSSPDRIKSPSRVFVCDMGDLFHADVKDEWIDAVLAVVMEQPQHDYQILTKRPQRMATFLVGWLARVGLDEMPPNVWIGTSIESDTYAWRAEHLRKVPAAVRFVSAEPLLGPLPSLDLSGISWLIAGGESGPGHRTMALDWAQALQAKCDEAGVAFYFKQTSGARTEMGKDALGELHEAYPLPHPAVRKGEPVGIYHDAGAAVPMPQVKASLMDKLARMAEPKMATPSLTMGTLADLMATELEAPSFVVEGLVPRGLTLLGGFPKAGKSWLVLDLALAVANGLPALGDHETDGGEVLYLALEDTPYRLKSRASALLDGGDVPTRFHYSTELPRLGAGGEDELRGWLSANPGARLVVVDVLANVRPAQAANAYEDDTRVARQLKAIADDHSVALLVVHHFNKAGAFSGSTGLTGAADALLSLSKAKDAVSTLGVTGRDVEASELPLSFNSGKWSKLNGDELATISQAPSVGTTRAAVLLALKDEGEPMSLVAIAERSGVNPQTVRYELGELVKLRQVERVSRGIYAAA